MTAAQTATVETTAPVAEASGAAAMPVTTTTPQVPVTGFAASHPGVAVQQTAPALPAGSVLTQVGSVLGGILLLILCGAWLVRRLGFAPQARNNKLLNVKASCQVGQRERVVIVEVDNTWLVLGVTSQQVTQLHTLPRPPVDDSASPTPSAKPADFRQLLNQHLFNKKSKHPEKSA
ncbi:flagellar biosynthetic protein FliO [Yersinia mollaretii]|uniref:Flagellar protein n=1 Tax=Yersinia mollaretii TaxID=33060 RepID=A0AA44CJ79_YERMO|nr:flagellar biosynthetic protein FliO [Yersinia mollaretii]CNJ32124.1 flagellar protein FliO [Yersinia mollaretii]CNK68118.1 flagellar protein FliO [Yersinia mollaretii]CQR02432.1 flagellar protein FliO [Yersinia mollaretii]